MGYEVHITRNKQWWDEDVGGDEKILRKMHQIASQLDAKVLGDEGEEYGADGELVAQPESQNSDGCRKPWWKIW
ncbi:MAG: hypothetical protein U0905_09200 [Pirellulales bacterium]